MLENKRKRILFTMIGGGVVLTAAIVTLVINLTGGKRPAKPVEPPPPAAQPAMPVPPAVPAGPKTIPVFLDFASSPLPATVYLEGKNYGMAPSKVNVELEPGREYTAEAVFNLNELQDSLVVKSAFTIEPATTMVPIFFKGPIGIVKVASIPRDTQLYIEGYYASDPFKPHTAKLTNVVFGKPVYVPYGKYTIELRQPKQLGESNQFIEDIRYKREAQITEDAPLFELSVTDQDLQVFPVEIRSVPEKADVFIDAQLVGQTPYKGDFPLGEHTLVLRKDGYFEHSQSLKMDINTPYLTEITLKTTLAGQFLNAGSALIAKGMYKDAVAQLSEAFKNQPTPRETAQAQYLLGVAYLSMGDTSTAGGYFEQAKAEPEFEFPAKLGLATIHGLQQNMSAALPLLVEVLVRTQDEKVRSDAHGLFRQLSPLRSVMYIYTDPEGAVVTVNDKPVGQKTPLILHDMGLGNYKIRIQKNGFVPQDLNINMSIAEFNPVIIKLKPVEE
jgi:tetratricopeptide (TPR) repeat protein